VPGERRQLAAVMLTDVVGYSALAQRDEPLALQLAREQDQIVRSTITSFSGRAVKSLGAVVLAAFDSALDAVTCALEIQDCVVRRNASSGEVPLALRIGVHQGDLIHHENDVFGDAVNIVARVERFAESGGICVSQQVFDLRRDAKFVDLLERHRAIAELGLGKPHTATLI